MKIFRAEPMQRHQFHNEEIELIDRFFVKNQRQRPSFNHGMFNQDFARLFRATNRSGNLFDIVSNDDELIQKLFHNVKTDHTPHSVDEIVRKLVEQLAQSLIFFGRAYYFVHDDTEQEEIHIAPFSSSGVVRLFGTHIQWVPKHRESHWDRDDGELPREIRILDAAKVMRFDMPRSIKRMLAKQNRILTVLDKHQFGETHFYPQATHENPTPTNHFDFQAWKNTQEYALYRATRGTGWDGRKYGSSKRSDFFDCHRLIRFRRNQLLLRDGILTQLGNELSRVGKGYKAGFSVEISGTDGLLSIAQLNELEVRLAHEEVGFNEIIDYCYKH